MSVAVSGSASTKASDIVGGSHRSINLLGGLWTPLEEACDDAQLSGYDMPVADSHHFGGCDRRRNMGTCCWHAHETGVHWEWTMSRPKDRITASWQRV